VWLQSFRFLDPTRSRRGYDSPSATRCSQLIAGAVTFTGNSYFRHDCRGAGVSDPDPPLLLAE